VAAELASHPPAGGAGEYNIGAGRPATCTTRRAWGRFRHVSGERRRAAGVLAVGLDDCFRRFEQPEKSYSWWDRMMLSVANGAACAST